MTVRELVAALIEHADPHAEVRLGTSTDSAMNLYHGEPRSINVYPIDGLSMVDGLPYIHYSMCVVDNYELSERERSIEHTPSNLVVRPTMPARYSG